MPGGSVMLVTHAGESDSRPPWASGYERATTTPRACRGLLLLPLDQVYTSQKSLTA